MFWKINEKIVGKWAQTCKKIFFKKLSDILDNLKT